MSNLKLKARYATDAINPYDEGVVYSNLVFFGQRFETGSDHSFGDDEEFFAGMVEKYNPSKTSEVEKLYESYRDGDIDDVEYYVALEKLVLNTKELHFARVYNIGQSDILLTLEKPHKTSIGLGFVYVTQTALDKIGVKSDDIKEFFKSELETYSQFINGDVYNYEIVEVDENGEELDTLDCAYGFYGDNIKANGMYESIATSGINPEDVLTDGDSAFDYVESWCY